MIQIIDYYAIINMCTASRQNMISPNVTTGAKESDMKMISEDFFRDWNYRKHAKFCSAVYLGLYAFDMTISYFIIKKMLKKFD